MTGKNYLSRKMLSYCLCFAAVVMIASRVAPAGMYSGQRLGTKLQLWLNGAGLGYEVQVAPEVESRWLPEGAMFDKPETLFDAVFPCLGLSYDMLSRSEILIQPDSGPWPGPEQLERTIPAEFSSIRKEMVFSEDSPGHIARQLHSIFRIPVILDYRISPYENTGLKFTVHSLREALSALEKSEGWEWFIADEVLFIIPSPEDRLLSLPNSQKKKWIYAGTPLEEVMTQLARSFKVEFLLSDSLTREPFEGVLDGDTLGEILHKLGRQARLSYRVEGGEVRLVARDEIELIEKKRPERKIFLELEILQVPDKRWKDLRVGQFLSVPLPESEENRQQSFFRKVRGASGVKTFARIEKMVEAGGEHSLDFPMSGKESKAGLYIRMRPEIREDGFMQIGLWMQLLADDSSRSSRTDSRAIILPTHPITGQLLLQDGKMILVHGPGKIYRGRTTYMLLAFKARVQQPANKASVKVQEAQEGWHFPWNIEVGGDVSVMGFYGSGVKFHRIGQTP